MGWVLSKRTLDRANLQVTNELYKLGLYNKKLSCIDVFLIPVVDYVYARFVYVKYISGIYIPAVSISEILHPTSIRETLRHEWGHAYAFNHEQRIETKRFRDAFGSGHFDNKASDYDPEVHVSEYAATNACEDFAEVFAAWVRTRGILPNRWKGTQIEKKWEFISSLA